MGESERYQLSIAHTSKRASNTSHNAARSKSYIGAPVNWILYLLFRERGGITFSHTLRTARGIFHFHVNRASHIHHISITYPSHFYNKRHNEHHDLTIPKIPPYLYILRHKQHTDTNDSHERMKYDEWNDMI